MSFTGAGRPGVGLLLRGPVCAHKERDAYPDDHKVHERAEHASDQCWHGFTLAHVPARIEEHVVSAERAHEEGAAEQQPAASEGNERTCLRAVHGRVRLTFRRGGAIDEHERSSGAGEQRDERSDAATPAPSCCVLLSIRLSAIQTS